MTTLIHVTATPVSSLALVMLRVDTSGDRVPAVTLLRRVVGSTVTASVIVPAGMADADGNLLVPGGSAELLDSTAPLDTPFEYLAGLPGQTPTVVCTPVTLASSDMWHLGDPARPYLDLALSRTTTTPYCDTSGSIIILGLSDDTLGGRGDVLEIPGRRMPQAQVEYQQTPSFQVRFGTKLTSDRQAAEALFATGDVLLLRVPVAYDLDPRYVMVDEVQIGRVSTDHRKEWRLFTVSLREVDQPAVQSGGAAGFRFSDLCSGGYATWSAMVAGGLSWASLGYGVGGGGLPAVMRTWAEVNSTWASWNALAATGKTWTDVVTGA